MKDPRQEPLRLYLIRHGETEWALSGRHTGQIDIALTAQGERDAKALGATLQGVQFTHAFTSPLLRATRTYELVSPGPTAQVDPDLVEWDYGDFEGLRAPVIRELHADGSLFSLGQFSGVLAARWISLPLVEAEHFELGTSSLAILGYSDHHPDLPIITEWNATEDVPSGQALASSGQPPQ